MQLTGEPTEYNPVGATQVDTKGQDFKERVLEFLTERKIETQQIGLRDQYKNALKINAQKAQAILNRRTAELQAELNISEDAAKKRAGAELITEREYITGGIEAEKLLNRVQTLLKIVESGDYKGGAAMAMIKSMKRVINYEHKDDATFRTASQMFLLELLKPLMGAKATDEDLKQLKIALAEPSQTTTSNIDILKRFRKEMFKQIKDGQYFANNTDASIGGLLRRREMFRRASSVPSPINNRPDGEIVRKEINGEEDIFEWSNETQKWTRVR